MKTAIEMAREAGFPFNKFGLLQGDDDGEIDADAMFERLVEIARADERAKIQPAWEQSLIYARLDEKEKCAKAYEAEVDTWAAWPQSGAAKRMGAAAIRATGKT